MSILTRAALFVAKKAVQKGAEMAAFAVAEKIASKQAAASSEDGETAEIEKALREKKEETFEEFKEDLAENDVFTIHEIEDILKEKSILDGETIAIPGRIALDIQFKISGQVVAFADCVFVTDRGIFVITFVDQPGVIKGNELDERWKAAKKYRRGIHRLFLGHRLPRSLLGWLLFSRRNYRWATKRTSFPNPIIENRTFCNHLLNVIRTNSVPVFSIVTFFQKSNPKKVSVKTDATNLCNIDELESTIEELYKKSPIYYSDYTMDHLYNVISQYRCSN